MNLARVFAQRCLESGISEVCCDLKPYPGGKVSQISSVYSCRKLFMYSGGIEFWLLHLERSYNHTITDYEWHFGYPYSESLKGSKNNLSWGVGEKKRWKCILFSLDGVILNELNILVWEYFNTFWTTLKCLMVMAPWLLFSCYWSLQIEMCLL